MPRSKTMHDDEKIASATLRLVAKYGWKKLTCEAVANEAKIPPKLLKSRFASPHALIPHIAQEIDREAFQNMGKDSGSLKDRLFDLLMARFDILQKYRIATLYLAEAARSDRALSCALARSTLEGSYRIAENTKIKTPQRPLLIAGVTAIYGWTFFVWSKDKTADMSKTMAALDRALRIMDKLQSVFKR